MWHCGIQYSQNKYAFESNMTVGTLQTIPCSGLCHARSFVAIFGFEKMWTHGT